MLLLLRVVILHRNRMKPESIRIDVKLWVRDKKQLSGSRKAEFTEQRELHTAFTLKGSFEIIHAFLQFLLIHRQGCGIYK